MRNTTLPGVSATFSPTSKAVCRLADRQLTVTAIQIGEQIVETAHQIFAIRLQRGAQDLRVRQHKLVGATASANCLV